MWVFRQSEVKAKWHKVNFRKVGYTRIPAIFFYCDPLFWLETFPRHAPSYLHFRAGLCPTWNAFFGHSLYLVQLDQSVQETDQG